MLQVGDPLCLGFEATHELRLVGQLGMDDPDGHLPPDGGLHPPVHIAEGALRDLAPEHVAADPATLEGGVQAPVLLDDHALELGQPLRRLQSGLVDQVPPVVLERTQRLGLAARPIQRHHQHPPWHLPQWLTGGERLGLGHHLGEPSSLQDEVEALLLGLEPHFDESLQLGLGPLDIAEIPERIAAPQGQRIADRHLRALRISRVGRTAGVGQQSLELAHVQQRLPVERVPAMRGRDGLGPERCSQP